MNGGDAAVVTERAETMSGLSREERRRKRKELKVELEKLKREIRRVDIKLAEAKKGGKGAKKQTSAGGRGGKGNSKLYSVGGETLVSPDYKQRGVKRKQSGVGASQPESKESRKAAMLKERETSAVPVGPVRHHTEAAQAEQERLAFPQTSGLEKLEYSRLPTDCEKPYGYADRGG